jgi:hypothetical protein
MQLLPVHRVTETECIVEHLGIVMDVIAVITIPRAAQITVRQDFRQHAITVIASLMHHGTRRDSIIDSQLPPASMPEIPAVHATQIPETSESLHV